jgi:hypothetical protein
MGSASAMVITSGDRNTISKDGPRNRQTSRAFCDWPLNRHPWFRYTTIRCLAAAASSFPEHPRPPHHRGWRLLGRAGQTRWLGSLISLQGCRAHTGCVPPLILHSRIRHGVLLNHRQRRTPCGRPSVYPLELPRRIGINVATRPRRHRKLAAGVLDCKNPAASLLNLDLRHLWQDTIAGLEDYGTSVRQAQPAGPTALSDRLQPGVSTLYRPCVGRPADPRASDTQPCRRRARRWPRRRVEARRATRCLPSGGQRSLDSCQ